MYASRLLREANVATTPMRRLGLLVVHLHAKSLHYVSFTGEPHHRMLADENRLREKRRTLIKMKRFVSGNRLIHRTSSLQTSSVG